MTRMMVGLLGGFAIVSLFLALPTAAHAVEGGEMAEEPWAVALVDEWQFGDALWDWDYHFCSGSLIAPNKVLTAAHCVDGGGLDLAVIGRANLPNDGGHVSTIESVEVHPCWDPGADLESVFVCADGSVGGNRNWDVAVVTLSDPAPSWWRVLPLAPTETDHLNKGVELFGYGKTVDDQSSFTSNDLLMTPVGVYESTGRCANDEGFWPWILCFSDGGNSAVEVLNGDSGAPWTWTAKGDRVQIAVHSGGGSPSEYGVDVVDRPWQPSNAPFSWVRDRAGVFEPSVGTVLRNPDNGDSWLVGSEGFRHPILTGGDYQCLVGQGSLVENVGFAYISQLPEAPSEPATCLGSSAEVSTVLIVDSSGSMGSSDPQNRRLDGASAYVAASPGTDEVAVVDFDGGARLALGMTSIAGNRAEIGDAIASIDSSGGTDLGAGLAAGCEQLDAGTGSDRAAIFLTDGQGSYSGQASCYAAKGWKVYAIGLGTGVNGDLLGQIATETGGAYRHLDEATNLACEFQQIRVQIAGGTPSPCESTGSITQDEVVDSFMTVLAYLTQVTFTNTWFGSDIEMTLTTPTGRTISRATSAVDVVVEHGSTFETITVFAPEPGEWKVTLFGADIPESGEPFTLSTFQLEGGSAPDALADSASTDEDSAVLIDVLANDTDADGDLDPSSVTIVQDPSRGTATPEPDGTVLYTPSPNANGIDSFTYQVCDLSDLCASADVSVEVSPVNDPPTAKDDEASTEEDVTVTVNVLANDEDIDDAGLTVQLATSPAMGVAEVFDDQSITYTPDLNEYGDDEFSYRACDAGGSCESATVTVTVHPLNDAPTCEPLSGEVSVGETLTLVPNCMDVDGDQLTFELADQPSSGDAVLDSARIEVTPTTVGVLSFGYRAYDGSATSPLATVEVVVSPPATAPFQATKVTIMLGRRSGDSALLRGKLPTTPLTCGAVQLRIDDQLVFEGESHVSRREKHCTVLSRDGLIILTIKSGKVIASIKLPRSFELEDDRVTLELTIGAETHVAETDARVLHVSRFSRYRR